MDERYSIDLAAFFDLSASVASDLDGLSSAMDAALAALRETADLISAVEDLPATFEAVGSTWAEAGREATQRAGEVLAAAQHAVHEYCRADAEMAVSTARLDVSHGSDAGLLR